MSTVRHPAIRIALFALAFRLASAVLAFLENVVFPPNQPETFTMLGRTSPFWDTFTRYDSGWYYQVARNGYQFVVGGPAVGLGKVGKIAYFPLYPLLMRWVGRLFGQTAADVYRGGIVVSWTAFVLAMVGLYYLARLDIPARRAERAVAAGCRLSLRVLFWRGVHGKPVSAADRDDLLRVSHASLDLGRTGWRPGDGDARERPVDAAGARLGRLAGGWSGSARAGSRSGRSGARACWHRAVLVVRLHADRQSLRVGGVDSAVGLLSGRLAVAGAVSTAERASSRIPMRFLPASAWHPTTP